MVALGSLILAIVTAVEGRAHHPGSHAARLSDGTVKLELGLASEDPCMIIAATRSDPPAGVRPPKGGHPVTVQLRRPNDAVCSVSVRALRGEAVVEVPADVRLIHLYVVGPDGDLRSTQRIPIAE